MLSVELQARLQQERWQDMIREAEAARRQQALLDSLTEAAAERPAESWLRFAGPRWWRALVAARRPSEA